VCDELRGRHLLGPDAPWWSGPSGTDGVRARSHRHESYEQCLSGARGAGCGRGAERPGGTPAETSPLVLLDGRPLGALSRSTGDRPASRRCGAQSVKRGPHRLGDQRGSRLAHHRRPAGATGVRSSGIRLQADGGQNWRGLRSRATRAEHQLRHRASRVAQHVPPAAPSLIPPSRRCGRGQRCPAGAACRRRACLRPLRRAAPSLLSYGDAVGVYSRHLLQRPGELLQPRIRPLGAARVPRFIGVSLTA